MKLTEKQYEWIAHCFPKPRKPPTMSNVEVLNALLYVLGNGCKWRALPSEYGKWHTVYMRINRWAKSGVLQNVFLYLQKIGVLRVQVRIESLDSTSIKVHPDGMGALKKMENSPLGNREEGGTPKFIWLPHLTETL